MNLTKPGVFAMTDSMTASQLSSLVRRVEELGYSSFWFPEAFGRDPFAVAAHILTITSRLIVGTGIANVWKREPVTMINAALVMIHAVRSRPQPTASVLSPVRRNSSRILANRNTS